MKLNKKARLNQFIGPVDVSAKVGSYVELDAVCIGKRLLPCDDWDGADFRWPNPIREWETTRAIACNVYVTGRTIQRRHGNWTIRVKIEFVGDGEPNSYSYVSGWMYYESANIEYPEEQIA